jgi:ribonuclease G
MSEKISTSIIVTHDKGADFGNVRISSFVDRMIMLTGTISSQHNIIGNIYVGHVENIVRNLNAAFVRFRSDVKDIKENTGYLPLDAIVPEAVIGRDFKESPVVRNGDHIIVQVNKPAVKTKQAALTTRLSVSGRYAAVTLGKRGIGCSRKLPDKVRDGLVKKFSHDFGVRNSLGDEFGCVLRTSCMELADNDDFEDFKVACSEIEKLIQNIKDVISKGAGRTIGTCLYEVGADTAFTECLNRHYTFLKRSYGKNQDGTDRPFTCKVIAENQELYQMLCSSEFMKKNSDLVTACYESDTSGLNVLYGISGQLEKALAKRVWLDSGAYLVIESTEAMHVIDVNTGKSIDKKGNLFADINIEAAVESVRQISLRNLTGMILIDFINMKSSADYERLKQVLILEAGRDPQPTRFVDFTGLGIGEIVRKK